MFPIVLDAILFPGASGSGISARPGYPSVIVPFAMIPNEPTPSFPDGFNAKPQPYGVSFAGMACSEPRLLALAYAFEQRFPSDGCRHPARRRAHSGTREAAVDMTPV